MESNIEKNITVGYIHQVRYDHSRRVDYVEVPRVQLSGKWLSELGFETGDKIRITAEKDRIVMQRLP